MIVAPAIRRSNRQILVIRKYRTGGTSVKRKKRNRILALLIVGALFLAGCSATNINDASISITPANANVVTGTTQQYTGTVGGNQVQNSLLTWSVNSIPGGNNTVGTMSAEGVLTAPENVPSPNTETITAAESGISSDGTTTLGFSASVPVTIVPASGSGSGGGSVKISVSPSTVSSGGVATLLWSSVNVIADSCTINGQYSIDGVTVGAGGSVQVSSSQTTSYSYSCTALNGGVVSQSATLTVQPPEMIAISLTTSATTVTAGGTIQVSAAVSNDPSNKGVTLGTSFGSLAPSTPENVAGPFPATYTAPAPSLVTENTNVTITATSVADPSISTSVVIVVTPASTAPPSGELPQTVISPGFSNVAPGGSEDFTCTVTGNGVTNSGGTFSLVPAPDPSQTGMIVATGPNTATYTAAANVPSLITIQLFCTPVQFPQYATYAEINVW